MKKIYLFFLSILFISISITWEMRANDHSYDQYDGYFSSAHSKDFLLDPNVNFNRAIFNFNYKIDEVLIDRALEVYKSDKPKWSKEILLNFTRNFTEPVNMVNHLLQRDVKGFVKSFWRFALNSTIGAFGLFDISESFDMEYERNGFDRTLAFYGVKPGSYVVLPWYGSFSSRSLIGTFADFIFNPLLFFFPVGMVKWEWLCYSSFLKSNSLSVGVHLTSLSLDHYETWKRVFAQTQQYNFK